jgi:hypothetical protein
MPSKLLFSAIFGVLARLETACEAMPSHFVSVRAKDYVSMRRPLLLLLKAAVSILLLYLSLRSVNLTVLGERLSRIEAGWIAAALILLAAQVVLMAVRWRTIAVQCGTDLTLPAALRISFIASFFNQVLPSTVGGDTARVWMLARRGGGWAKATYSVLIDRIAGVFVLALLVIGSLPWTLTLVRDPIARTFLLLIGSGAIAGAIVFMAIGVLRSRRLNRWMVTRHLVEISRAAWRVCRSGQALAAVTVASFAIHLLTISTAWCLVQSIDATASFAYLLFLIPPVLLITTIPVSIAGWGLREGSMIVAFGYAGLAASDGLIVSVLIGLAMFAIGAVGGIVWIVGGLIGNTPMSVLPPAGEAGAVSDEA